MTRNATYDIAGADIPLDLFPTGRIRFSLGVRKPKRVTDARAKMDDLRREKAWRIFRAILDGRLVVSDVVHQLRQNGAGGIKTLHEELDEREIPTVRERLPAYYAHYRSQGRKPSSIRDVTSRLEIVATTKVSCGDHQCERCNRKPEGEAEPEPGCSIEERRIDQVRSSHLEQAIGRAANGSANTFNNLRSAISAFFRWVLREEADDARIHGRKPRITTNPVAAVKGKPAEISVRIAREGEVRKLLAVADLVERVMLLVLLHLGLRRDELIHLRYGTDIDLARRTVRIQARGPDPRCGCAQCQGEGWSPKNGDRTVEIPKGLDGLRRALLTYARMLRPRRGDYFFLNPNTGRMWTTKALQDRFARLCKRADVPYGRKAASRGGAGITLHTLRHTCATNLIRANVRESVVAGIIGDTIQTVVRTYVHLDAEDLARGLDQGPRYDG